MCGPHHCLGRVAFASAPEILRRLLQLRQNTSILEQGCAGFSPGSPNRCDQFTRHPGRTSSPLRPRLSCRYTQEIAKALGYELCKCEFPPTPMLTVGELNGRPKTGPVYECPKCGFNTAGAFMYNRIAPERA